MVDLGKPDDVPSPDGTSSGPGAAQPPADPASNLLQLRGVGKSFGPVHALADVDLEIPAGQVTALVGDNGAGKTTLIKCIAGIWEPTTAGDLLEGPPGPHQGPKDATDLGIATVYQDLALCDNLDIVQNMMLGHEKLRGGILDEISMEKTAKQTLADLAVTTVRSVRQTVGSLSGGQRQSVAVAKAVMLDAQLVDHGRADRRAWGQPDRAGALPDPAACQPRPRGDRDLA